MNYADGQEVHVGDFLEESPSGPKATVVFIIDTAEYSEGYSQKQWGYLRRGFMILSEQSGLTHFNKPDENMRLLNRALP